MRIERREGYEEREVITAMIVDSGVLGRIESKWEPDLFRSKWSNLVASWCVKFYRSYDKAPGRAIEGLFESWAQDTKDEETVKLVERFLGGLSNEYKRKAKEVNPDYVLDIAGKLFNRVRATKLAEAVQGDVDGGNLDKALKRIAGFGQVEIGVGSGVDILRDKAAIQAAFEGVQEPLVKYPGALGRFFGNALERDAFIAFQGPEKRGKSVWLLDVAWRAMLQRRRVAYFQVGDMSQNQVMRRFMARASGIPIRRPKSGVFRYPTGISRDPDEMRAEAEFEEREVKSDLSFQAAWKACDKVLRTKVKSDRPFFRLSCHPNSSISVTGIRSILLGWEREGWIPDVVCIDYADVLAPISSNDEGREQINKTWNHLRSLSQSLHCLVVTATQADAASYAVETMSQRNFSDDKRKMAHVTGMIGLNATPQEKEDGLMRLNWIVLREGEFSPRRCVHVAGCLDIYNPAVRSTF